MCVRLVSQSYLILCLSMDRSLPAPLSTEFSSKNTGMGSHSLLQGIFLTQGSNPGLLHCRQILDHVNHQGSPRINHIIALKKKILGRVNQSYQLAVDWKHSQSQVPLCQKRASLTHRSFLKTNLLSSVPTTCPTHVPNSPKSGPCLLGTKTCVLQWQKKNNNKEQVYIVGYVSEGGNVP